MVSEHRLWTGELRAERKEKVWNPASAVIRNPRGSAVLGPRRSRFWMRSISPSELTKLFDYLDRSFPEAEGSSFCVNPMQLCVKFTEICVTSSSDLLMSWNSTLWPSGLTPRLLKLDLDSPSWISLPLKLCAAFAWNYNDSLNFSMPTLLCTLWIWKNLLRTTIPAPHCEKITRSYSDNSTLLLLRNLISDLSIDAFSKCPSNSYL